MKKYGTFGWSIRCIWNRRGARETRTDQSDENRT